MKVKSRKVFQTKDRHVAFNDGNVEIYSVENIAEKGDKPKDGLILKQNLHFRYDTIGIRRNYAAMQENVKLSELIVIYRNREISTQNVAVINGRQFRIHQVQHIDTTAPPTTKLSLVRLEVDYDTKTVP